MIPDSIPQALIAKLTEIYASIISQGYMYHSDLIRLENSSSTVDSPVNYQ